VNGQPGGEAALLEAVRHRAPASSPGTEIIRLYGAKAESAVRLAYHITRDREAALDLSQEAFVKAIEGLPGLDEPSSMEAWFDRIVVNLCRDWIRRRGSERKAMAGVKARAFDPMVVPGAQLEAVEDAERVRAAMLDLPLELREAFAIVCVEGLAPGKAAYALGIPEGTLRWRLHEARRRLLEQMR
jgi:RNA polymerase sigma-70 factor (ECF subfamily)